MVTSEELGHGFEIAEITPTSLYVPLRPAFEDNSTAEMYDFVAGRHGKYCPVIRMLQ
jgi:hypothetical protein